MLVTGIPSYWAELGIWWLRSGILCALVCLILVISFVVYFYVPCWGVRRIPGPPTDLIVGHLPMLAKSGPDIFRALAKEYGPVFRFHMGRQPLVIVAEAELCREVGMKKFKDIKNRSKPFPASGSSLHEKGLFLTKDLRWSSMRNAIIPFYQPSHLANLIPTVQSVIESATSNLLVDGEEINISHFSLKIAIDIIGKTAFGVAFGLTDHHQRSSSDSNDDEISGFLKQHMYSTESLKMDLSGSLSTIMGLLLPILQKPCRYILQRIPGTTDRKMLLMNRILSDRIDQIVEKRASDMNCEAKDFLSALLIARNSELGKDLFTYDYISALAYEHLVAGTATTAFTVSSIVYLLCKHPNVERKLIEEIDRFGPKTHSPSADDIHSRFPYLDQVVKEAMRVYTVSPLVARETSTQVQIGGYSLPKGTWVWLALGVLAKDSGDFPDPDVFKPERFDPNSVEARKRHPYAHIPFGLGPRTCIGQRFALFEIKLAIIHLYGHYGFRLSPKMESPPELEYGLVLNFKHGIKVQPIKRS